MKKAQTPNIKIYFFKKAGAFLSSALLFFSVSMAWPLPYSQTCSEDQKERTSKLAPFATEAGFCFQCEAHNLDPETAILEFQDISLYNAIPKECFLAIAVRGNQVFKKRYVSCSDENNANFLRNKKFCVNEDYITAIHESFRKLSYCFDFDRETQRQVFHLINHESGGILNARSETEARCLGQITIDYVKDINKIIKQAYWKRPHRESGVWRDLLERCPELEANKIEINSITCQSTQNPETCLLYSFFGKKRSLINIQERLDDTAGYMGNREFPTAEDLFTKDQTLEKQKYRDMMNLLPMKRKEMLLIKGTKKNGEKMNWVMWDDSEIYDNKIHEKIDWTKELEIKKVDMFESERDIKTMFMYWSHNGGSPLSRVGFTKRLEELKKRIAQKCSKDSKELRCRMRRRLQEGSKIPNALALKYFERDLLKTYSSDDPNRRQEVSVYVRKIIDSRSLVFNPSDPKNKAMMLDFHEENGIDEGTAKEFLKDTDEICPKTLDINEYLQMKAPKRRPKELESLS